MTAVVILTQASTFKRRPNLTRYKVLLGPTSIIVCAGCTLLRISIFGLGRVGLVTAACFAKKGFQVLGIDPNLEKIKLVRSFEPPFFEPGLEVYLRDTIKDGTLTVTDVPDRSEQSDIIYIAVGTPSKGNGAIDLTQVKNAATMIGRQLRNATGHRTVVSKSTVVPGTARNVIKPILESESRKSCGVDFSLLSNPEFLREGNALHDTEFPDRIVIGGDDTEGMRRLESLHKQFYAASHLPVIRTTHENAELIKYASNAFLATKISFANTMAAIAERIPCADVSKVTEGMCLDARIGPGFLDAGLGYGGSCLPKDVLALIHLSRDLGYEPSLLSAASEVNERQSVKAVEFVKSKLGSLRGKKVAILGLAFKPSTDDMREAVSIPIINGLLEQGASIAAYDPMANQAGKRVFGDQIKYAENAKECIRMADLAVLVTDWEEFAELTAHDFLSLMNAPVLFDGRRMYDSHKMRAAGIDFSAIGLGPELPASKSCDG
jgi:UDPglucose 6-dehydrogenase